MSEDMFARVLLLIAGAGFSMCITEDTTPFERFSRVGLFVVAMVLLGACGLPDQIEAQFERKPACTYVDIDECADGTTARIPCRDCVLEAMTYMHKYNCARATGPSPYTDCQDVSADTCARRERWCF